jgi:hypothetical protein
MLANSVYQFLVTVGIVVLAALGTVLYLQRGQSKVAGGVAPAARGRRPMSSLTRLTMLALLGAAVGTLFGVAEGIMVGHLHFILPLALTLVYLLGAGLIATQIRWMVVVGLAYALVMLIGAALGSSWIEFRLFHSEDFLRYVEIWVELSFTLLAAILGVAAIVRDLLGTRLATR